MIKNLVYLASVLSLASADWNCQSCQEAATIGTETALSETVLK